MEGWNDLGLGDFQLGCIRDKSKREMEFIVFREGRPWFLVEAKHADTKLSLSLAYLQRQLRDPYAFQGVIEADYVNAGCFAKSRAPSLYLRRRFLLNGSSLSVPR